MKRLQSNTLFASSLNKLDFDLETPKIFEDINLQTSRVPPSETLISIPQMEQFSEQKKETPAPIDQNELRDQFVRTSLCSFATEFAKANGVSQNEAKAKYLPPQFQTTEEFVEFKRKIRAYLQIQSEKEDISPPIDVCLEPSCLNSAIPTFKYCLSHIEKDEKFSSIPFLHKCQFESDQPCDIPCPTKYDFCVVHRKFKSTKK